MTRLLTDARQMTDARTPDARPTGARPTGARPTSRPPTAGTWQRSGDIAVVEHEARIIALDLDRPGDPPVVLEGTAAAIWHLMTRCGSQEQLVTAVARAFGQAEEAVADDVHAFLLQLEGLGLVTNARESS